MTNDCDCSLEPVVWPHSIKSITELLCILMLVMLATQCLLLERIPANSFFSNRVWQEVRNRAILFGHIKPKPNWVSVIKLMRATIFIANSISIAFYAGTTVSGYLLFLTSISRQIIEICLKLLLTTWQTCCGKLLRSDDHNIQNLLHVPISDSIYRWD